MSAPAQVLTELFAQRLESPEGKEKIAEYGGNYIRDRLREVSFARKIIPTQPVTRADCQRSVNHDTLVKIVDVEPKRVSRNGTATPSIASSAWNSIMPRGA